jgi:2'-5' RNA ligase
MSTSEPLRLFFALPCPAPVAHAVAAWRDRLQLPGKAVAAENLHLTLAFLGAQPRSRLDELKAIAAGIRGQAFELHLDRLGHWRAGLLHLLPSRPPEALLDLECSLRERLLQAGYEAGEPDLPPAPDPGPTQFPTIRHRPAGLPLAGRALRPVPLRE